jgi:hypothetical protein
MSLWNDEKYLRLVSTQLERFTQKHPHLWAFRCPLCGDSEHNRYKTRGYCFPGNKRNGYVFSCHNCQVSLPFSALLKRLSPRLYDEYLMEQLQDKPRPVEHDVEAFRRVSQRPTVAPKPEAVSLVQCLSDVAQTDDRRTERRVLDYILNRQIPRTALDRLWSTMSARTWLKPLVGEKSEKVADDKPYLVIPLTLPTGEWYGCQMRDITKKDYITYIWAEKGLKVFGLSHWTPAQPTIIVEGPLDALFIPNAIAACGSDLRGVIDTLEEREILPHEARRVYVWDCEPRNIAVVKHMQTAIRLHETLVIWPRGFPVKDINDAVKAGIDILSVIAKRTFTGLRAELEFSNWKS